MSVINCENCRNASICKWVDKAKEISEKISHLDIPENSEFNINLNCKKYNNLPELFR